MKRYIPSHVRKAIVSGDTEVLSAMGRASKGRKRLKKNKKPYFASRPLGWIGNVDTPSVEEFRRRTDSMCGDRDD